jgi:hypothetical protein
VPTIVDLVRLHPYQYVSFNRIAAGIGTASHRYMLDYWGLGLNEAAAGLRRRIDEQHLAPPAGRKWKVAVCGPADIVPDILGSNFDADNDPRGADFALSMGTYYCARLKAPILATAQREGVVFARAYDLRGLSFATTYFDPDKDWKP